MRGSWALAAILAAWPTSGEQVPLALDNERNGSVITHMFPYCGGNRVGGFKPISVPPDRCLSTHGLSFRILQPAICPNGTRAKLARFPDSKCSKGEITALNGLTDIADSDISTSRGRACKETSEALKMPDGSWAKQGGMVFWCDPSQRKQPEQPDTTKPEEPEVPKPQARKASVSHNSCWGKGRPTAPVFPKISHDTCVNLDKGKQLKIYSLAVCPDGSESRFTTFQGRNCRGAPADAEPEKDVLNTCMSLSEDDELDMSYAFLCDGLKEVKMTGETSGEPKEQGSILGLVLILCLIGATFLLIGVLTCLKWASLLHRILDIFRKQDGAIRL